MSIFSNILGDIGSGISSVVSDIGTAATDVGNFVKSNPVADAALLGGGALLTGGLALPALGLDLGSLGGLLGGGAAAGASDFGADAAGLGSWLGTTDFGAAATTPDVALGIGGGASDLPAGATLFNSAAATPTVAGAPGTALAAPTVAGGGGDLSGLTAADVNFLGQAGVNPDTAAAALANPAASGYGPGVGDTALSYLKSAGPYLGLAGLGATSLLGQLVGPKLAPALPNQANLTQLAQQEQQLSQQQQQLGTELSQPELTGQLPPAAQQAVQNALNDAITSIKAKYASLGLSGSTMEQDAITAAQNNSTATTFQIAQQMAQQGAQATSQAATDLGLQETIYQSIMQATIQQDQNLSNAISGFANAVGGGLAIGTGTQLVKNAASS